MDRAIQEPESIDSLIDIANRDSTAEFEVKLLAGKLQTRDISERIRNAIETLTVGEPIEEHRLTYIYPDGIRVNILEPTMIHKVCTSQSFKGIQLNVERKTPYFDSTGGRDLIDVTEMYTRFTLRSEKPIKKDFSGDVNDVKTHIRVLHRKTYTVEGGEFKIDFSMVKSKQAKNQTLRDVLKNIPSHELEIEYIPRKNPRSAKEVRESLFRIIESLLAAYQESPALLTHSEMQKYVQEFRFTSLRFFNIVSLERRHISPDTPHNILKGYTVTNKADGLRAGLFVARDRRLLRVTQNGESVCWTGLVASNDSFVEDFLDGEFIESKNLFCVFDIYRYKTKNVSGLPLFTTDDEIKANPESSRLGCANLFVKSINTDFRSVVPGFRIETKLFLAGDGIAMEEAIRTILDTEFEYETDGLVFTPRLSAVAPPADMKGRAWLRVYKWKPPHQNSIDFLLKFEGESEYDSVTERMVKKGTLYISRTPGEDIIYPCETITGEYIPPKLPEDLQQIADTRDRVPSPFQPSAPKDETAHTIWVPVNRKNVAYDIEENRVEDNTIVECSYDMDLGRWNVMRTRYDKTYQYRVMKRSQYGNDLKTAESIWTLIHVPISEDMLKNIVSNPSDDTFEDDVYYREEQKDKTSNNIRGFHNRVKESQYHKYIMPENTLMEIAVGRGGDLLKWKKTKPSLVLGIDYSQTNLTMKSGACTRYLNEKKRSLDKIPKALFVQGDMKVLFEEQESRYLRMIFGNDDPATPYIAEFKRQYWDAVSCQFAIHYACENEETLKVFLTNLKNHCKSVFFGTCLDGKAVYSLLAGKDRYILRSNGKIFVQFDKKYTDDGEWKNEFGQRIDVMLESTEKMNTEYLVPFDRIQELFVEYGFDLLETSMFSDVYSMQRGIALEQSQQEYSFLHRTFAFKRRADTFEEKKEEPKSDSESDSDSEKEEVKVEELEEVEIKVVEEKPKKIKATKKSDKSGPPPDIVFFFKEPETAYLSNMYDSAFKMEDSAEYKTAEHAFQAEKAATFDRDKLEKIINAKSAQSAKAFGKKIENFKQDVWDQKKENVMKQILRGKFSQNPPIRKLLLETGSKTLAYSDPRDTYWGIGTSSTTSIAKDPAKWKGQNKLGKMLMELRDELRAEDAADEEAAAEEEEE